MTAQSLLGLILSAWHIPLVQWAVYATVVLWLLYVYVMRLKRIRDNEGLSLIQRVVGYPVALIAMAFNWTYNRTIAAAVFREWPKSPKELTTQRLQRVLDNPDYYCGYRLKLARWWKPHLNRRDPGHLE